MPFRQNVRHQFVLHSLGLFQHKFHRICQQFLQILNSQRLQNIKEAIQCANSHKLALFPVQPNLHQRFDEFCRPNFPIVRQFRPVQNGGAFQQNEKAKCFYGFIG